MARRSRIRILAASAAAVVATVIGLTAWKLRADGDRQLPTIYQTTSAHARHAYDIARTRHELLAQLPCHCGCMVKGGGHSSVLECFKTAHAETCTICIQTAEYADRAAAKGVNVDDMKRYLQNVHQFELK